MVSAHLGLQAIPGTVTKSTERVNLQADSDLDPARLIRDLSDLKFALDQSAIVATTDVAGKITYVNDKFCRISQYAREELLGQDHRIINSGHHSSAYFKALWQTIAQGEIWNGEIRNRAKDGSFYWVDTTIVPFISPTGRPYQYMAIRFDITERKRAETKLLEQQTLARLGEMSAVVAHEVRNPLAGISGALQVIGSRLPETGRDRAILGDIQKRIESLNEMVQDLLLFARPTVPELAPTALGSLLADVAGAIGHDPDLAAVRVQVTGENPSVSVDREQMRIVFQNLFLNAAQAMNNQGTVRIHIDSGPTTCVVSIIDEGPGLTAKVAEEMFEPFFTTKNRGSGLGLPTARRIVEAHKGRVTARSRSEGGAEFQVSLPAALP